MSDPTPPAPGPATPPTSALSAADALAKAESALRARDVELAVYKNAGNAGLDAAALLDSRSFMDRVNGLDHATESYQSDLAALIGEAATDPRFTTGQAAQVPVQSGPDVTGTAEPAKRADQMSVDELREARAARRKL
ncbi:hypothetical protein [Glycomyces sp. YM15]|uniref:hypothetical protein n=1 Tax=Glycomyces sp. YM15 TaxID=2800446 RepID=UPI001962AB72|nr:hypothetical protein [Glycomyces sp. YM15]